MQTYTNLTAATLLRIRRSTIADLGNDYQACIDEIKPTLEKYLATTGNHITAADQMAQTIRQRHPGKDDIIRLIYCAALDMAEELVTRH